MIEEKPASKAPSYEPWSKCKATGTVIFNASTIALTIAATVVYPVIYLAAPSETPKITGAFNSSAVNNTDLVHSKLLILNWPTA